MHNETRPPASTVQSSKPKKRSQGGETVGTPPVESKAKRQKMSGLPSRRRRKEAAEVIRDSEEEVLESLSETSEPERVAQASKKAARRSSRTQKRNQAPYNSDEDFENGDEDPDYQPQEVKVEEVIDADAVLHHPPSEVSEPSKGSTLDIDTEEDIKLKPKLQLQFRQLQMKDRVLCIIVEPWPLPPVAGKTVSTSLGLRSPTIAPSERLSKAAPSLTPSDSEEGYRGQTPMPLFLPSHDERDRSVTPAPIRFESVMPAMETIDNAAEAMGDFAFGMLAFSQALANVVGDHSGGLDEDDEMDGSALYGDADETRTMTL